MVDRYRWGICALLFAVTAINYADRQILGILATLIEAELHWSESDYGLIVTAFQGAYALGLVIIGRAIDLIGTRWGYVLALAIWSVAAVGHGLVASVGGFALARFALGLGEAGNFPAAIKAVAEWFPKRERAFATGLFNAGTNVGAILTPLLVPWIAVAYGWRAAFLITGAVGFLWLPLWLVFYRPPRAQPRLSASELAYIESDADEPDQPRPAWFGLLRHRQTWGLMAARFCTDPIWWFYLYWVPKFLHDRFGLSITELGPPIVTIYLVADAGSIVGGWLPTRLVRGGWSLNAARKLVLLLCALCACPIVLVSQVSQMWTAVALLSLATAGHQGWAANIFTIVSDIYPRSAVSSLVGLCGFGGAIGGMLAASATGLVLDRTGSYLAVFAIAGSAYLIGLGLLQLFVPRLDPVAATARPTPAAP